MIQNTSEKYRDAFDVQGRLERKKTIYSVEVIR